MGLLRSNSIVPMFVINSSAITGQQPVTRNAEITGRESVAGKECLPKAVRGPKPFEMDSQKTRLLPKAVCRQKPLRADA